MRLVDGVDDRVARSCSILPINGAFGSGKTATAGLPTKRLDGSKPFHPEHESRAATAPLAAPASGRADENRCAFRSGVRDTHRMSALEWTALPVQGHRLVLVTGEEGAGKSTIIRALLPHTQRSAQIDAEDIGQTNPCLMDDQFIDLLRRNVAGLVENFWAAGYRNVIAG